MDNQINNTGFTKTLLMILVVFCHAIDFWTGKWFTKDPILKSNFLNLLAEFIGSFHIYCFVLISGYLFAYGEKNGKYKILIKFLQNKAKRLIVPYYFVAITWVAPIAYLFFRYNKKQLFCYFLLGQNPNQLWFLWMLFCGFFFLWIISKYMKKNIYFSFMYSIILNLIGVIGNRIAPDFFQIWTSMRYVIFLCIGYWIYKKNQIFFDTYKPIIGIIGYLVLFYSVMYLDNANKYSFVGGILRLGMNIIGAITAFYLFQLLAQKINWEKSKICKKIIKLNMPIYLFHQQFIYVSIILFNGKINPYLNAVVNFSFAIVGSFIISCILIRFKMTRFLIGEK